MWPQKLLQSILKISYYKALFIPVLASPMDLNTWQLHPSRIYTIYCAIMHLGYLTITPSTYTSNDNEQGFMARMPVLHCVQSVANASCVFAIIAFIAGFWKQRASLIACCKSIEDFCWRYRHRLRSTMPGSMQVKQKIELIMLSKYCITYVNTLLIGYNFFSMGSIEEIGSLNTAAIHTVLTLFLGTIVDQFCHILTQLLMQFECVNQSLRSVILQLKALDHELSLNASETFVRHRARSLQRHLSELNGMHHHCFKITQCVFKIWELAAAGITLKIVMINICNLYHWVLILNNSLKTEYFTYLFVLFLTIGFYVDAILLTAILDALLDACNKTGMLLHECSDLLQLRRCVAAKLTQSLEQFSLALTCRRLSFCICGLFNFDRQMGLRCLVFALLQTTVLMQYDLQAQMKQK